MPQKSNERPARGGTLGKRAADLFSVLLVCLSPVAFGAVFFRILYMGGAPVWVYAMMGAVFLCSAAQVVYFFAAGLLRALRRGRNETQAETPSEVRK